jgi:hypothetical protein
MEPDLRLYDASHFVRRIPGFEGGQMRFLVWNLAAKLIQPASISRLVSSGWMSPSGVSE